jgi:tRNA(Ile)-lysidine synthase
MGPHPAVAQVRRAVRPFLREPVLVACSGGADSLALAAAVAFEAPRARVAFALVTVDHGLFRGSAQQAARVAAVGYDLGFDPVVTVPVSVGRSGGPEAAARSARYTALDATAAALQSCVLLGHTLDDQAETVLLGLGRGSGPRSIAGMAGRSGCYGRPLLGVRRATTVSACAALGLPVWDDPANCDPALQRVRLRAQVLPLLEDVLQGGVAEALARTAAQVRDDLEALDSWASAVVGDPVAAAPAGGLEVAGLTGAPRAVRTRVLRTWALQHGARELGAGHLAALDALITDWHGQGPLELPGGLRVLRASGRLHPVPANPVES